MQCLRCQNEMSKTIFESVLVDYCPICQSFWLDGGEFEQALKGEKFDVEKAFHDAKSETKTEGKLRQSVYFCPKCRTGSIKAVTRNGVKLDQCDLCSGLWFDEGELESLFKAESMKFFERMWGFLKVLI